jgi:hypothetical protein
MWATVVIRLSPHLDLGVLMRTYPNVADLGCQEVYPRYFLASCGS